MTKDSSVKDGGTRTEWPSATSTTRCLQGATGGLSRQKNWKEFRSEGWRKAWTGERHYAVSIIQADDRWDIEHATNYIDSNDLYPGGPGVTSLGSSTRPNTSNYFWGGSTPKFGYSGVTVKNIVETEQTITASLSFIQWQPLTK